MGNKNKAIRATAFHPSGPIVPTDISHTLNENIRFSFKFLETVHPKFRYSERDAQYFNAVLERLKAIGSIKVKEFRQYNKTLRNHPIKWGDNNLTEKGFGLTGHSQLDDNAFQFSISANENGRVIGSLIGTTFFVVWLDPDHKTYA